MRMGYAYILCKKHYKIMSELDSGFIENNDIINPERQRHQIWDVLNQLSQVEYLKKSAESFIYAII